MAGDSSGKEWLTRILVALGAVALVSGTMWATARQEFASSLPAAISLSPTDDDEPRATTEYPIPAALGDAAGRPDDVQCSLGSGG